MLWTAAENGRRKSTAPSGHSYKKESPMKPTLDRVLVKLREREERTPGGLYIPANAQGDGMRKGDVVAVGPGKWTTDGSARISMEVQKGDVVLFHKKYADGDVQDGEEKLVMLTEGDIQAVVEE
jgi:chaperonin GroES